MAGDRGSLRGSGRAASGPLVATWQMMEWIRDNGPADRDTIIENCARFLDEGYARRWYARHILTQSPAKVKRSLTREQAAAGIDIATVDVAKARAVVVGHQLRAAVRTGTLTRQGDVFAFVRMPARTPGGLPVESVTSDPRIQRRHVYAMELVRQLRAADKRGGLNPGRHSQLLKPERDALLRWLSTFDDLDEQQITVTGVELEAIIALRALRARQDGQARPRETDAEKVAVRALWLALDNFRQP